MQPGQQSNDSCRPGGRRKDGRACVKRGSAGPEGEEEASGPAESGEVQARRAKERRSRPVESGEVQARRAKKRRSRPVESGEVQAQRAKKRRSGLQKAGKCRPRERRRGFRACKARNIAGLKRGNAGGGPAQRVKLQVRSYIIKQGKKRGG